MGLLADRVSRKRLLAAGIAVWGSLTGLAAWAHHIFHVAGFTASDLL